MFARVDSFVRSIIIFELKNKHNCPLPPITIARSFSRLYVQDFFSSSSCQQTGAKMLLSLLNAICIVASFLIAFLCIDPLILFLRGSARDFVVLIYNNMYNEGKISLHTLSFCV